MTALFIILYTVLQKTTTVIYGLQHLSAGQSSTAKGLILFNIPWACAQMLSVIYLLTAIIEHGSEQVQELIYLTYSWEYFSENEGLVPGVSSMPKLLTVLFGLEIKMPYLTTMVIRGLYITMLIPVFPEKNKFSLIQKTMSGPVKNIIIYHN